MLKDMRRRGQAFEKLFDAHDIVLAPVESNFLTFASATGTSRSLTALSELVGLLQDCLRVVASAKSHAVIRPPPPPGIAVIDCMHTRDGELQL